MSAPAVGVIGAGGWGTALALLMAKRGQPVPVWGHDAHHVEVMRSSRRNEKYLPGIELPTTIRPTADLGECLQAPILLVAVPSKYLAGVTRQLAEASGDRRPVLVSCTKGIEREHGLLMSEVMAANFPGATVAVLSGPNLAGEIAGGVPAAGVIGCDDPAALAGVQALFEGTTFRAYTSCDLRGIQLGGALKNVFAIAAGVSDGLGLGENAKAALVTRSLAEMTRLGTAMGGRRETFSGLSGIGDLMVTCFSERSRNHQVGLRLARGESLESITSSMSMVAEGVPTTASARIAARRLGVETPLIDGVHAVLEGQASAPGVMQALMSRQLKAEEE
jgi:glycerol-3-phosphate dehydrogenase (NAD(P)+)